MSESRSSSQDRDVFFEERIRQARLSFNLSICFASISATVTVLGVVLLLAGRLTEGGYAALGSITSTTVSYRCVQLARDANDRLDLNQRVKLPSEK